MPATCCPTSFSLCPAGSFWSDVVVPVHLERDPDDRGVARLVEHTDGLPERRQVPDHSRVALGSARAPSVKRSRGEGPLLGVGRLHASGLGSWLDNLAVWARDLSKDPERRVVGLAGRRRTHLAAEALGQEQLDLTVVPECVPPVAVIAAVALIGEHDEAHVLAGAAKGLDHLLGLPELYPLVAGTVDDEDRPLRVLRPEEGRLRF